MNWILAAISIHQRKSKETVVWVEKWNGEKKQSDIRRKKKENQQSSRYSSMESVGQVSWNVFHISSVASISHIAPDHQYTVVVYTEDNRKRQKEKNTKKKKEENKKKKNKTKQQQIEQPADENAISTRKRNQSEPKNTSSVFRIRIFPACRCKLLKCGTSHSFAGPANPS